MCRAYQLVFCAVLFSSISRPIAAAERPEYRDDADHRESEARTAVLTGQYGNDRTSANLHERKLNPSNVNVTRFGKVGSYQLDGLAFAQPLYVPNVEVEGRKRNVLYVATMANSIYALNADEPGRPPLWHVNLGRAVPARWAGICPTGELGVLGTPVIDRETKTLYVVSATPNVDSATYIHRLFALDIRNGTQKFGSPKVISAEVPGNGTESRDGKVAMDENKMMQRPALLLSQGNVYAGFGGCGPDPRPFHGWLLGYRADNVQEQTAVFNVTANADMGSIWQSGRGPVADDEGSIYFMTGNSPKTDDSDFGESFVKLSRHGKLLDWFVPHEKRELDEYDLDLGSSGPILADSNLLVGGGKEGVVYALDPHHLGKAGAPLQRFRATQACATFTVSGCQQIHFPAYWKRTAMDGRDLGAMFYVWGYYDNLRAYRILNGAFETAPDAEGGTNEKRGGNLTISAEDPRAHTAILWARTESGLYAYDARNVAVELWNSNQNATRDELGTYFGLSWYTVANGRVYVPVGSKEIVVYGLLRTWTQNP